MLDTPNERAKDCTCSWSIFGAYALDHVSLNVGVAKGTITELVGIGVRSMAPLVIIDGGVVAEEGDAVIDGEWLDIVKGQYGSAFAVVVEFGAEYIFAAIRTIAVVEAIGNLKLYIDVLEDMLGMTGVFFIEGDLVFVDVLKRVYVLTAPGSMRFLEMLPGFVAEGVASAALAQSHEQLLNFTTRINLGCYVTFCIVGCLIGFGGVCAMVRTKRGNKPEDPIINYKQIPNRPY